MDITVVVGVSLIALTVAVMGLLCGLLYFLHTESHRLSGLEAAFATLDAEWVRRVKPMLPQSETQTNPYSQARRDELLRKLEADRIARHEAIELSEILAEEERKARERGEIAVAIAIGLGLALLAALLARKG